MRTSGMAHTSKYTVSLATEADLPTLVDIQFKVYATFAPEILANGEDTPANQAKVLQRHLKSMQSESGLRIAKAEVNLGSSTITSKSTPTSAPTPTQDNESKKIIGFCMFCLPNEDAKTPLERIPQSIRPRTELVQNLSISDPNRRAKFEKNTTAVYNTLQRVIAGRPCGWIRYMSVLPAYQRQGIGRLLIEWGCRIFDEKGFNVCLQATVGGEGLYRQFGFERVSTTRFEVDDCGRDGDEETKNGSKIVECAVMWRDAVGKFEHAALVNDTAVAGA